MIPFYRLSGGGNDFLALAEPVSDPSADHIRAWCRRGVSLGADGLFVLRRDGDQVTMTHFNADGGRAELCVNGARCAARLAMHLGWTDETVRLSTDSGRIEAESRPGQRVALTLKPPTTRPSPLRLDVEGQSIDGHRMVVGTPHLVIEWTDDLSSAPVEALGPALRSHPDLGPPGANVHWVHFGSEAAFSIRSFERGVEAETLACGSGVLAAAAVGVWTGELTLPTRAETRGGFVFEITGEVVDRRLREWSLVGDARLIASGEIVPGGSRLPTPPGWAGDDA